MYTRPLSAAEQECLRALTAEQWKALLNIGKRQTVTGLLAAALDLLPEDFPVPAEIEYPLMAEADRLEKNFRAMTAAVGELGREFRSCGLQPLFLKGLECARYYPVPALREQGDIDVFFPPGEYKKATELVLRRGWTLCGQGGDGSFHFAFAGFDVDLHREYYDLPKQRDGLPPVPSPEAELLMLNVHILKHACSAGVGLRQFCDMALAYAAFRGSMDEYERACRRAGVFRWTRLLSSFLNRFLDAAAPLFGQPAVDPAPLEAIVRRGGNFGHHEASRRKALSRAPFMRKADTLGRIFRSIPFSLRYAPGTSAGLLAALLKGNSRKSLRSVIKKNY